MPPSAALSANAGRNAGGSRGRRRRWRPVRDASRALLTEHVPAGADVAVIGAGNGDTLPLRWLARHAGHLELLDLDPASLRRARRTCRPLARAVRTRQVDITAGEADAVVARAAQRRPSGLRREPRLGGPYDIVIGDLLYTQLLYPALSDAGHQGRAIDSLLLGEGQRVTDAVVARMHAAAPLVIHLHDLSGWWDGHPQPFTIDELLDLGARDPDAALALAATGTVPYGCDLRRACTAAGTQTLSTTFWRWPFSDGTDYAVCATIASGPQPPAAASSRPQDTAQRTGTQPQPR